MANFSTIQEKDLAKIESEYDIGKINYLQAMPGGSANSSFFMHTRKGRYIFTICDEKDREEAVILIKILQHLRRNGFSTTRAMVKKNGEYLMQIGGHPAFLKYYISGQVYQKLNYRNICELGSGLAVLHSITPLPCLPKRFSYGVERFSEITSGESEGQFAAWLTEKEEELLRRIDPDLPRGLIHGDIFNDNVLFENNRLKAIIDFEEACNYYFIFDIGMCIVGTCVTAGTIDIGKAKCLLKGYHQIRQTKASERAQLKLFTEYAAIATCFWRYRQFGITVEEKKHDYREMIALSQHVYTLKESSFNQMLQ